MWFAWGWGAVWLEEYLPPPSVLPLPSLPSPMTFPLVLVGAPPSALDSGD